jgi:hypothetical protein
MKQTDIVVGPDVHTVSPSMAEARTLLRQVYGGQAVRPYKIRRQLRGSATLCEMWRGLAARPAAGPKEWHDEACLWPVVSNLCRSVKSVAKWFESGGGAVGKPRPT